MVLEENTSDIRFHFIEHLGLKIGGIFWSLRFMFLMIAPVFSGFIEQGSCLLRFSGITIVVASNSRTYEASSSIEWYKYADKQD